MAIPNGETPGDCISRATPVWKREILPDLRRGRNVLVVAHGNSIRAIVQAIDGLSDDEVCALEIPPCIPLVYRFERKGAIEQSLAAAEGAAEGAIDSVGRLRILSRGAERLRSALRGARRRRSDQEQQQWQRARELDLVSIRGEVSSLPLTGEYLAKPAIVAAAQERMRVASRARYGIGRN